jgi:hypothetical protein
LPSVTVVTEADYISHCLFQSTFSQRPLHKANASAVVEAGGMDVYEMDSDGLLEHIFNSESAIQPDSESLPAGVPPFPLNDFYLNIGTSEQATGLHDLLLTLFPLLFVLPALKLKKNEKIYPSIIIS